MSLIVPATILDLKGQCVKRVHVEDTGDVVIECSRDRRRRPIDPASSKPGTVARYFRRRIRDLPLFGQRCFIDIEQAQVRTDDNKRHIEELPFVDAYQRCTKRFTRLVSGLCRYMSIHAVSIHLGMRWETVKNIDKAYLHETLPALHPERLTDLKWIGVDEVARAKGQDYMTVVYDLVSGALIWVEEGRTADVLGAFFEALPQATAEGIEAISMDMGRAYQKAARDHIPNADVVFDRFHVMQNYSKLIRRQRNMEFRKSTDKSDRELINGSLFLLLKNPQKLKSEQLESLEVLRDSNQNLNLVYMLKEQLQALWDYPTSVEHMRKNLEAWCQMADASTLFTLKNFAKSLRAHAVGICNYAKYRLTNARVEAGNVSIGQIRKRARGIRDVEYFKLKIRQVSIPDTSSMFYPN